MASGVGRSQANSVAVIGLGAFAVAFLWSLKARVQNQKSDLRIPMDIEILDPADRDELGGSRFGPFNIRDRECYANTECEKNGVDPGNPAHFVMITSERLGIRNPITRKYYQSSEIPLRADIGSYLNWCHHDFISEAPKLGIRIGHTQAKVDGVSLYRNGEDVFRISFAGGKAAREARQVVFATGSVKAQDPFRGALKDKRYYFGLNAKSANMLAKIANGSGTLDFGMIGSGAGMADVFRRLDSRLLNRWKATVFGREKSRPWWYDPTLGNNGQYELKHITPEAFRGLAEAYRTGKDSEGNLISQTRVVQERFRDVIRKELECAKERGAQNFLYSPTFESLLTQSDIAKRQPDFKLAVCNVVSFFRGYFVPEIDGRLIEKHLGEDGGSSSLTFVHADVRGATATEDGIVLSYRKYGSNGGDTDETSPPFKAIVNGSSASQAVVNLPLYQGLSENGIARFDRETGAALLGPQGQLEMPGAYALLPGSPFDGEDFSVAGIETGVKRAWMLAGAVLNNVGYDCNLDEPLPSTSRSGLLSSSLVARKTEASQYRIA